MTWSAVALSVTLAFLFGIAAQLGNLCAVAAIITMIEKREFGPFFSLVRYSAWVIVISLPVWWLCPAADVPGIYAVAPAGLAGAAVFGVGAVINGACNFGTLTRFAAGDASFATTALGMAAGVWIEARAMGEPIARPVGRTILAQPGVGAIALLACVTLWCVIGLLSAARETGSRRWAGLAPMVVGLTGGALYLINGSWTYVLDVGRLIEPRAAGEMSTTVLLVLTAATEAGAAAAALAMGKFRPLLNIAALPNRLAGGLLMGFGAALVPGGNAVLILHGIPAFSPHAVPAYLALCLGIAVMLQVSGRRPTLARFRGSAYESVHNAHAQRGRHRTPRR